MRIRKSHLIGALAAAAALAAGAIGAQTFEQTVDEALKKDGAVLSEIPAQRQLSTQDPEMIEAQRGGGGHGGGRGPGGEHGGGRGPGGGHENPGHGHENPGRGPGHENPGRRPGPGPGPRPGPWHPGPNPDHGWHRWHGHPGWGGRYNNRWGWDPYGRPVWLGWGMWNGAGRCDDYYRERDYSCHSDCREESNACVADCTIYAHGEAACFASCGNTSAYCDEGCDQNYDEFRRSCPAP